MRRAGCFRQLPQGPGGLPWEQTSAKQEASIPIWPPSLLGPCREVIIRARGEGTRVVSQHLPLAPSSRESSRPIVRGAIRSKSPGRYKAASAAAALPTALPGTPVTSTACFERSQVSSSRALLGGADRAVVEGWC